MKKILVGILVLSMLIAPVQPFAFAGKVEWTDPVKTSWDVATYYPERILLNLGTGLENLTLGWTDILVRPHRVEFPPYGIVEGVFNSVIFTVGGALKVAFFWLPVNIPLPHGGVRLIEEWSE